VILRERGGGTGWKRAGVSGASGKEKVKEVNRVMHFNANVAKTKAEKGGQGRGGS